jgi:hypothetical protein
MKTITHLYISLILLSTSLLATDKSYSFLGIQAGDAFVEGKSTPTIGLKYGVQTRKYRTSLNYNYGENSKSSYQTFMMQIDTGILLNSFRNSLFRPYAGFSFGVMQEKNKARSIIDRGYLYGLNTGLAYIYNDTLDFDLSYKYLKTSKLNKIDSINDLSLSMHYFY